jgi:probable rRNA maturation factor
VKINTIKFFYPFSKLTLDSRSRIKRFLFFLFKSERKKVHQINYVFCSDKFLLELNQKYLKHKYKTDILTFPFSGPEEPLHGEIYISVERTKVNARRYHTTFKEEILRLIFHGALHLCGFDDASDVQKQVMKRKEDHYLKLFKSFT